MLFSCTQPVAVIFEKVFGGLVAVSRTNLPVFFLLLPHGR